MSPYLGALEGGEGGEDEAIEVDEQPQCLRRYVVVCLNLLFARCE
jgi:hypothetical protein